jgi:drug/metabolite transporter (DMT)-like permease
MLTGASVVMVPLALAIEGAPSLAYSAPTWAALAYLAFAASALAYLLYYAVLQVAGAGNLSLVTLLIPPIAIALGAVVYAEALHLTAYLGFALLALGLLILDGRIGPKPRPQPQESA